MPRMASLCSHPHQHAHENSLCQWPGVTLFWAEASGPITVVLESGSLPSANQHFCSVSVSVFLSLAALVAMFWVLPFMKLFFLLKLSWGVSMFFRLPWLGWLTTYTDIFLLKLLSLCLLSVFFFKLLYGVS